MADRRHLYQRIAPYYDILDYVLPEHPRRRRTARLMAPVLKFLFNASAERNTE